jgi:ABC-type proline/glycine betaine transport system ATPase subunit
VPLSGYHSAMIEFRGVTKRFDDGTVLVGPSGCGKTTSLRMVNQMVEPSSGTVLVGGQDIRSRVPAQLRRGEHLVLVSRCSVVLQAHVRGRIACVRGAASASPLIEQRHWVAAGIVTSALSR